DCPDRRLYRSAMTTVAQALAGDRTEVLVLLPERKYRGFWHRILHDQTAETLAREISRLPHANVTTVPFNLDEPPTRFGPEPRRSDNGDQPLERKSTRRAPVALPSGDGRDGDGDGDGARVSVLTSIGDAKWRARVRLTGRVDAIRIEALAGSPTLECRLVD